MWLPAEVLHLIYHCQWQHRMVRQCQEVRQQVERSEPPAQWTTQPSYRLRHLDGRWHRPCSCTSMDYHCLDWGLWHPSKVPRSYSIRYICLNTQVSRPAYRVYRHSKRYVFGWEISRKGISHYKPGPECCDKRQWGRRKRNV